MNKLLDRPGLVNTLLDRPGLVHTTRPAWFSEHTTRPAWFSAHYSTGLDYRTLNLPVPAKYSTLDRLVPVNEVQYAILDSRQAGTAVPVNACRL